MELNVLDVLVCLQSYIKSKRYLYNSNEYLSSI